MATTPQPPEHTPMRGPLFQRWLLVWHVLYIGGLLTILVAALWDSRGAWDWQEALLIAIVIVLIALYARVLIFDIRWPYPNWFLALYFGVVIALLALAVWINPVFIWGIAMLIGQMFGILPPLLAIPGVVAVMSVIMLAANQWQLPSDITPRGVLFIAVQLGGMFIFYLYIYHVFRASQERSKLVNELTIAKAELERARDAEAELATLRERERVARDLHDGLGHSLVTMSVQLEAIQRLYPVDPVLASARVDELKRLTRDSMTQLRSAIDGLRASERDDRPLSQLLQEFVLATGEQHRLAISADIDPAVDDLPPLTTEAIWRIVQEAMVNVERHAQAHHVSVTARVTSDQITLSIVDDGCGLPPNAEQRPGHYGLRGMRERVEGLGGVLNLENRQTGGTVISATIPI